MSTNIEKWDVEGQKFWDSTGKSIANRNLLISIPSLLLGFAIWMMWGIITVQMLNWGFPFTKEDMFSLTAIAGLPGATLRIPSSFFIQLVFKRDIWEFWDKGYIYFVLFQATACHHNYLQSLIDGSSPDGLYFRVFVITDHTSDCSGNYRNM